MRRLQSLFAVMAVVIAGCAPAQPTPSAPAAPVAPVAPVATAEKRSENQVIKIAQVGLPPAMTLEGSQSNHQNYWPLYDNLVALDQKFNVIPQVAEKWELTNPTTWRLHLRKDVTFSNGDKLTAADAEFTVKFVLDRKTPQVGQIASVLDAKAIDDYTLDVINKQPDASTMAGLPFLWLMPKAYFEKVGRDGFTAKPIGSGPYEMAEFRAGDLLRFAKRSSAHPFRQVTATTLEFRSITQVTSIIAGLQTGDIDIAYGQFTADQLAAIEKASIVLEKRLDSNISALFPASEMETRPSPTKDKRVRQALNYAVDKEALAKQFYRGEAQAVGQLGLPDTPMWDPDLKAYPYDPKKAKDLLAEAGYPNGFKLPIGLEFTPQTANSDVMLAIQSNLRDVGVEMAVNSVELAAFLDKFYARNGQTKGDLFVTALPDPNGFASTARNNYGCDKTAGNVWYCNKEFDRLLAEAGNEPDVTKRTTIARKAAKANVDDVSSIYLLVLPRFIAHSPKIKGFVWRSVAFFNFDGAYRVA